jgi:hypothetical protein
MRKFLLVSAALGGLALSPALAEVSVSIEPEVDAWVTTWDGPDVVYEGDVVVGATLPDTVEVVEVPASKKYRIVRINKKRVLVDADTRKVIKIYD